MKCSECGEAIGTNHVSDGRGHDFCNNLCRVLFEKRPATRTKTSGEASVCDRPRFLDELRNAYQNPSLFHIDPYLAKEVADPPELEARKGLLLRAIPVSIGYVLLVVACLAGIALLKENSETDLKIFWPPLVLIPVAATFFLARDRGRNPFFWALFALALFPLRWSVLIPFLALLLPSQRKLDEFVARSCKTEAPERKKRSWSDRIAELCRPRLAIPYGVVAVLVLLNATVAFGSRGILVWLLLSLVLLGLIESLFLRAEKIVAAWALSLLLLSLHVTFWRLFTDKSIPNDPRVAGFNPYATAKFLAPVRHDDRSANAILSADHERKKLWGQPEYSSWELRRMLMFQVHPVLETCYEPIETHVRRRIQNGGGANLSNPWTGHRDLCANMIADHLVWSSDSMVVARDGVISYLADDDLDVSVQLFQGDEQIWLARTSRSF